MSRDMACVKLEECIFVLCVACVAGVRLETALYLRQDIIIIIIHEFHRDASLETKLQGHHHITSHGVDGRRPEGLYIRRIH